MQFMVNDLRSIVRYARQEPSDDDEHGDAVPTFVRESKVIQAAFVPIQSVRTSSDSGISESEIRYRVFVSYAWPFKLGDRMGESGSTKPGWEVVSCLDFPGSQNMEVRPIW